MGSVELAVREEGRFRRLVAVKRLNPQLRDDPVFRDMFFDEARIAGLLNHPNVVGVVDFGESSAGPFLVMDYVDGLHLGRLIRVAAEQGMPLPVQACVRIAKAVADGLRAAHELKDHDGTPLRVVHRDLSPNNILLGFDGTVRVTDFGIAKAVGQSTLTATGVLKGKLGYMAPERLLFETPDHRSDLFALGVVLFEMLSGRRLYRGKQAESAKRILEEPPPDIGELRPEVDDRLVALVFRLLAKAPEHRPQSAAEVSQILESLLSELLTDESPIDLATLIQELAPDLQETQRQEIRAAMANPVPTGRTSAPPAATGAGRRHRLIAAGSLVLLATLAGGVWWVSAPRSAAEPSDLASPPEVDRGATTAPASSTDPQPTPALAERSAPPGLRATPDLPSSPSRPADTGAQSGATDDAPTPPARQRRPRRRRRPRAEPATGSNRLGGWGWDEE